MALHWKILIGLGIGAVIGVVLNIAWTGETWRSLGVGDGAAYLAGTPSDANANAGDAAKAVRFAVKLNALVGELFVRALKFIGVPVVLFALIGAVAGLGDLRKLGRIGGKTIGLFLATGFLSVVIGVLVADAIRPGEYIGAETRERLIDQRRAEAASKVTTASTEAKKLTPWGFVGQIIPTNPFESLAKGEMLQIVFLSVALGIGLTLLPREKAEPAIRFCDAIFEAVLVLVRMIMRTAPVAVFALITPIVATLGVDVLRALGVYCLAVLLALGLVLFGLYPAIMLIFTPRGNKVGYRRFFRAMAPAQLLAFSSSSSAATLPVTLQCTRDRLGVSEQISGFVCTVGTTINMDGTALYQAVAASFLAQLYGIPLSFTDQVGLVLLSTMIAIGTPGVPGAGIVLMVIVLNAFNIPTEGIAIILAVDRVLDMARTVINVSGDGMGAAVVAGTEGQLGPDPASGA